MIIAKEIAIRQVRDCDARFEGTMRDELGNVYAILTNYRLWRTDHVLMPSGARAYAQLIGDLSAPT